MHYVKKSFFSLALLCLAIPAVQAAGDKPAADDSAAKQRVKLDATVVPVEPVNVARNIRELAKGLPELRDQAQALEEQARRQAQAAQEAAERQAAQAAAQAAALANQNIAPAFVPVTDVAPRRAASPAPVAPANAEPKTVVQQAVDTILANPAQSSAAPVESEEDRLKAGRERRAALVAKTDAAALANQAAPQATPAPVTKQDWRARMQETIEKNKGASAVGAAVIAGAAGVGLYKKNNKFQQACDSVGASIKNTVNAYVVEPIQSVRKDGITQAGAVKLVGASAAIVGGWFGYKKLDQQYQLTDKAKAKAQEAYAYAKREPLKAAGIAALVGIGAAGAYKLYGKLKGTSSAQPVPATVSPWSAALAKLASTFAPVVSQNTTNILAKAEENPFVLQDAAFQKELTQEQKALAVQVIEIFKKEAPAEYVQDAQRIFDWQVKFKEFLSSLKPAQKFPGIEPIIELISETSDIMMFTKNSKFIASLDDNQRMVLGELASMLEQQVVAKAKKAEAAVVKQGEKLIVWKAKLDKFLASLTAKQKTAEINALLASVQTGDITSLVNLAANTKFALSLTVQQQAELVELVSEFIQ